jgi:hypothetical protein
MTIPTTVDEAQSAAWLSSVLGAEVTRVVPGPVDQRVSTNLPVHVELADGGARDLWIKGYFGESGAPARAAGLSEAMFYRELRDSLEVRTLRCVHAEVDGATSDNVVVTEDVAGAVFLDGRTSCTPDQVAQGLEQLAALHAATWTGARWAEVPWLASRLELTTVFRGVAEIAGNLDGANGARVPPAVRDPERLFDEYTALGAAASVAEPWCVVHADPHIGNVYLDREGRTSFLDWQLVQRGPWYLDVGYHIATMLTVDDRRGHEAALVSHYLERLAAAGVDPPAGADVERGLRRGVLHGFYLWGITLHVKPEIIAALLERLGTAVDDHGGWPDIGRNPTRAAR